jgi:TolB protein
LAFTAFDATGRDPLIRIVPARGGPTTAIAAGIAPSWSHDGSRIAYIASGKPEFATDWNSPGRNDERIETVRLTGPGAGEVEVVARGLWPRWAPADDRLAYSGRRDANWDIYVRSADGLSVARLTDDPALDTRPLWTDGGRTLVFLSNRGNRWDLYRIPADGRAAPVRLTDHRRREEGADLRPDGAVVAFHDAPGRPDGRILLLDLARGSVRSLLAEPDGDRDPAWSPDGRSIAFASRRR